MATANKVVTEDTAEKDFIELYNEGLTTDDISLTKTMRDRINARRIFYGISYDEISSR